ncbi:hypothetical protein BASA81_005468 [Batrachochytrium salamandrivorans]|nr:hypothetical protein BASA81_005468 [Batrachochytrium salamandrivorans]
MLEEKTRTLEGSGSHWDYLLKEMAWMSNDFRVERKWKFTSAKKLGKELHRAFQRREMAKKREFQARQTQLKKTAHRVCREVRRNFWDKIDRVVLFKNNAEYFAEQQEIMDRNLERLLAQTERYTASLIANAGVVTAKRDGADTKMAHRRRTQYIAATEERELRELQILIARYSSDAPPSVALKHASKKQRNKLPKRIKLEEDLEEEEEEDESFGEEEDLEEEEDIDEEDEANSEDDGDADALENDLEIPLEELMRQRDAAIAAEAADEDKAQSGTDQEEEEGENEFGDDTSDEEYNEDDEEEEEEEDDDKEEDDKKEENDKKEEEDEKQEMTATVSDATTELSLIDQPVDSFTVPVPFLLSKSRPLRTYQREGLDWLVSLYDRHLNGILADEMGLGKTAQTISLLAHLAGSRGIWGPHLVIVPTSVILNWDLEFKMWCPGLKVLTYFGSAQERAAKRAGWTKPNSFHVCVTSYQLAVQDANIFRRKRWIYLIADEAHNLKNSKSQRWQTLLSFQAKRRLLITGTPLQNSLMELWSLMHFLMPHVFRSQHEFRHWFSNPLQAIVESTETKNGSTSAAVKRLHAIMRPFILRRLKKDVASQLPSKHEHIVRFPLARRQRMLYEEFVNLKSTQESLANGGYMGMMSVLMKLRMCCNHPDLLEPRLITSSFCSNVLEYAPPKLVFGLYDNVGVTATVIRGICDAEFEPCGFALPVVVGELRHRMRAKRQHELLPSSDTLQHAIRMGFPKPYVLPTHVSEEVRQQVLALYHAEVNMRRAEKMATTASWIRAMAWRVEESVPRFGSELVSLCLTATTTATPRIPAQLLLCNASLDELVEDLTPMLQRFVFCTPAVQGTVRLPIQAATSTRDTVSLVLEMEQQNPLVRVHQALMRPIEIRQRISFPDRYLAQYDSGKLQALAVMLHRLKQGKHRVLIFTQMTKMLDLLERFLNLHSHTYFRLDGSTKVEDRQTMMDRFNRDSKVFCFILSTRSGGLGINLTGADTVIFFDSDWNPQMDAQATDRAHRIGQTREVHIYRLIAEQTVEENILLKSNQKRHLSRLSVEEGNFTGSAAGLLGSQEEQQAMALVEDESDQLATLRAKQEEDELERGDNEDAPVSTSTASPENDNDDGRGEEEKKIEDEHGNVLMTMQQYQELETRLTPLDQYAMEFRQTFAVVVDKLREARRQKELDRQMEMASQQEEDWEIDKLEHERRLLEEEAEEDLIQSRALPEWEADLYLQSKRRSFKLERKLRKITGGAWKKTQCKQLNREGRGATTMELAYYLNEDTEETAWEKPAVLDFELARKHTRMGGYACLPQSVLGRISRFVVPSELPINFRGVCLSWYRAGEHACWVGPRHSLTIGSRVEIQEDINKEHSPWFAGTICDLQAKSCTVMYTEGTLELEVEWARVRPDTGARLTIIRAKKPGGPVFQVLNPTLASQFAGGTPALPVRHTVLVAQSLNKFAVLVVNTGQSVVSKLVFSQSQRVVGESFYQRERGAYLLAGERIVRDDLQHTGVGEDLDFTQVDCLELCRASLVTCQDNRVLEWVVSPATGGGGRLVRADGLVFTTPMLLTGASFAFRDCLFQRGVCVGDKSTASFEGCLFVGNVTGAGAVVGNYSTARFVRCRFVGNAIGLHAVGLAKLCSLQLCEVSGNASHAVVGPVTQVGATSNHFSRPSYGPLSIFTRRLLPSNFKKREATTLAAAAAAESKRPRLV